MSRARDNRRAEALFRDVLSHARRWGRGITKEMNRAERLLGAFDLVDYALLYAEQGAMGCLMEALHQNETYGAGYDLTRFTPAMMACGALAREILRENRAYRAAHPE